ncbi:MAG: hypothetical protein ACRYHA_13910, partial [Janthinobacterium lividum]
MTRRSRVRLVAAGTRCGRVGFGQCQPAESALLLGAFVLFRVPAVVGAGAEQQIREPLRVLFVDGKAVVVLLRGVIIGTGARDAGSGTAALSALAFRIHPVAESRLVLAQFVQTLIFGRHLIRHDVLDVVHVF